MPEVKSNIETLITKYGVINFYVGNQGRFDSMVASVLKEMVYKHSQISYRMVLAYLPKDSEKYNEKNTLYPYGIESVPKSFCISWGNKWMVNHSQYVICYVSHITGGALKFVELAQKKKRTIINLS